MLDARDLRNMSIKILETLHDNEKYENIEDLFYNASDSLLN
jgi:hypothetical protein